MYHYFLTVTHKSHRFYRKSVEQKKKQHHRWIGECEALKIEMPLKRYIDFMI